MWESTECEFCLAATLSVVFCRRKVVFKIFNSRRKQGSEVMPCRFFWRYIATGCLLCGMTLLAPDQAVAQSNQSSRRKPGQIGRNRPTVSPYTSLLNDGTSSGVANLNYYNIVQPQLRAQRTARSFSNELHSVESQFKTLQRPGSAQASLAGVEAISTGRMAPTGHHTAFGNLGGYFPGALPSR